MADYPKASSAGRSANMRAIRRTDTKPELALRQALHRMGYRFRKDHRIDLDGGRRVRPDIAFTARKVAVFVDGCFWHGCARHCKFPAGNRAFWEKKLSGNQARDRRVNRALRKLGWRVVRIWEHDLVKRGAVCARRVKASLCCPPRQAKYPCL